jgi:hypothetical protein
MSLQKQAKVVEKRKVESQKNVFIFFLSSLELSAKRFYEVLESLMLCFSCKLIEKIVRILSLQFLIAEYEFYY